MYKVHKKQITLMVTWILKRTGSSETAVQGDLETGKTDYKCLKQIAKYIHPFLNRNSHETSSSEPLWKAEDYVLRTRNRMTLDLGTSGIL